MPYIKKEDRIKFENDISKISKNINSDGELNYVITLLVHNELLKRGRNYQNMNNLVGVLECVKNEFIREVVSPYENIKKEANGNISFLDRNNE